MRILLPPVAGTIKDTVPVFCPEKDSDLPGARDTFPVGLIVRAPVLFVLRTRLLESFVPIDMVSPKEFPPFETTVAHLVVPNPFVVRT